MVRPGRRLARYRAALPASRAARLRRGRPARPAPGCAGPAGAAQVAASRSYTMCPRICGPMLPVAWRPVRPSQTKPADPLAEGFRILGRPRVSSNVTAAAGNLQHRESDVGPELGRRRRPLHQEVRRAWPGQAPGGWPAPTARSPRVNTDQITPRPARHAAAPNHGGQCRPGTDTLPECG